METGRMWQKKGRRRQECEGKRGGNKGKRERGQGSEERNGARRGPRGWGQGAGCPPAATALTLLRTPQGATILGVWEHEREQGGDGFKLRGAPASLHVPGCLLGKIPWLWAEI